MGVGEKVRGVATRYGQVVRSPSFFPLWLAQLLSSFGDTLHYIVLVVLVYQLAGQGAAVTVLVAAEIVPVLLLGPIAGVVIDRFSRKRVSIGADLFRAVLVLSLLWPQGAWHAYLVAAGVVAGNTFFNPTVQAVIPALTTPEQRLAANSVGWSTRKAGPDRQSNSKLVRAAALVEFAPRLDRCHEISPKILVAASRRSPSEMG